MVLMVAINAAGFIKPSLKISVRHRLLCVVCNVCIVV